MNACTCTETSLCASCRDGAEREWVESGVMPPDPRHTFDEIWADRFTELSISEERTYGARRSFDDFAGLTRLRKRAERDTRLHELTDADLDEAYREVA